MPSKADFGTCVWRGRYRFTIEPNLNKVVLERAAGIGEDRIVSLLREPINRVTPDLAPLRSVPWVHDSTVAPASCC